VVSTPKAPTLTVLPSAKATDKTTDKPAGAETGLRVLQPSGWPMPKGYANGISAEGRIVVTGGVIGWDQDEQLADGFVAQARQVLQNIAAILAEGDAEPQHLVRLTWYVIDMDEYLSNLKELGRIYREIFGTHYPAMALVQVVRLVEAAARLEIEATAVVPG
jgi:enamine deaminase RidA (YjgF/YER057c/UK114 family)